MLLHPVKSSKFQRFRMFFFVTGLTLLLSLCSPHSAAAGDDGGIIEEGAGFLIAGRTAFYAENNFTAAVKELEKSRDSFCLLGEGYARYYWLARVEFLLAEIAEVRGEKRKAAEGFTESGNLARKALEYERNSSDALRVLADSYMRLISYNGTFYMMSNGPKAMKLLQRAISLDKTNYAAYISLGTYYLNAPAVGGGSVEKGIKALFKALESKDEFDIFLSCLWLGTAYQKAGEPVKAKEYLNRALEVYPLNGWARGILRQVEEG